MQHRPVAPTDLLGTWTLTRTIDDRLAGERRAVVGTATLELEAPGRVRWSEQGVMSWAGRSVPVTRTLYVDRLEVGWLAVGWMVHFSDGRPFHPWVIGHGVDHPCGADHYRGLVETQGDPVARWTVAWQARGPDKDYTMTTVHADRSVG